MDIVVVPWGADVDRPDRRRHLGRQHRIDRHRDRLEVGGTADVDDCERGWRRRLPQPGMPPTQACVPTSLPQLPQFRGSVRRSAQVSRHIVHVSTSGAVTAHALLVIDGAQSPDSAYRARIRVSCTSSFNMG
jgi:hypothetical protein